MFKFVKCLQAFDDSVSNDPWKSCRIDPIIFSKMKEFCSSKSLDDDKCNLCWEEPLPYGESFEVTLVFHVDWRLLEDYQKIPHQIQEH
jgi:hypothetical protein